MEGRAVAALAGLLVVLCEMQDNPGIRLTRVAASAGLLVVLCRLYNAEEKMCGGLGDDDFNVGAVWGLL